jgi:hypothetical protein
METVVALSRHYPIIFFNRLREIRKNHIRVVIALVDIPTQHVQYTGQRLYCYTKIIIMTAMMMMMMTLLLLLVII